MPTMKPISWERNSRKELLYFPEIRTIILPYCRMIVLLKTEANANKMSLFFPSTVLSLNNPDNIGNFVSNLQRNFRSFIDGKQLTHDETQQEIGKRNYQKSYLHLLQV